MEFPNADESSGAEGLFRNSMTNKISQESLPYHQNKLVSSVVEI